MWRETQALVAALHRITLAKRSAARVSLRRLHACSHLLACPVSQPIWEVIPTSVDQTMVCLQKVCCLITVDTHNIMQEITYGFQARHVELLVYNIYKLVHLCIYKYVYIMSILHSSWIICSTRFFWNLAGNQKSLNQTSTERSGKIRIKEFVS